MASQWSHGNKENCSFEMAHARTYLPDLTYQVPQVKPVQDCFGRGEEEDQIWQHRPILYLPTLEELSILNPSSPL